MFKSGLLPQRLKSLCNNSNNNSTSNSTNNRNNSNRSKIDQEQKHLFLNHVEMAYVFYLDSSIIWPSHIIPLWSLQGGVRCVVGYFRNVDGRRELSVGAHCIITLPERWHAKSSWKPVSETRLKQWMLFWHHSVSVIFYNLNELLVLTLFTKRAYILCPKHNFI